MPMFPMNEVSPDERSENALPRWGSRLARPGPRAGVGADSCEAHLDGARAF